MSTTAFDPIVAADRVGDGELTGRRALLLILIVAWTALLIWLAVSVLAPGGWTVAKVALFGCLALNAPWLALAGATSLIGFVIRVVAPDPSACVLPILKHIRGDEPVGLSTALAVCTRNEPPEGLRDRLAALLSGLVLAGHEVSGPEARFVACILSDTNDPGIIAREEAVAADLVRAFGEGSVVYRRRTANDGFKAGNVLSFLDAHADRFDAMLCLDADSTMTASTVLRLVRVLQSDQRLGIVQPCFAGLPAARAFTRLFQFGHRQGLRIWATGQAWWQGDQGVYWGHNAVVRVSAFRAHCRLDPLPDGSLVLSHDHVEAARLQGAGWKVRVLPEDEGSFEGHPPTLPDMMRRDARWAAGNLQYRWLLRDRSLGLPGRLQMLQAILHYGLTPFWFAMLPLSAVVAWFDGPGVARGPLIALLMSATLALYGARLMGYAELMLRAATARRYGGRRMVAAGALAESLFTLMLDPVVALEKTAGLLALLVGRHESWGTQNRVEERVPLAVAARLYWPHTLLGLILEAAFLGASPWAGLVALPATLGLILVIPFATATTGLRLSHFLKRRRVAATPEELCNMERFPPVPLALQ